ncbi:MAG TPA: SDR family NAD(P)-dependent oxidoreductase [Anaeromyxobacteraceae bacterium]|nr:SDR family NAD(P)-dependent oxidoreductase [Anaeromyxobacteraceae bacterium]
MKVALITGANAGIGKEVARQLGALETAEKIYLACRNEERATAAKADLEARTGKSIFEIVLMDVSDPSSVRAAIRSIRRPVDALVMNAGGIGGREPLALTKAGVTQVFALNLLGHVELFDGLLRSEKLTGTALYVGSEAARGVPKMRMQKPTFASSSVDEFVSVCNGQIFAGKKADIWLAYGQVKYLAALWIGAAARKHPELRILTVSPGQTSGTEAPNNFPGLTRLMLKYVMMPIVAPLLGIVHSLETGSKRLVDAIVDPAFRSGTFYASDAKALTGPLVDQSAISPELRDATIQDNAWEAVHRFLPRPALLQERAAQRQGRASWGES